MDPSEKSSSSSTSTDISDKNALYLLTNICNLVSVRLDSTNFVLWSFQITPILRAHKLFGFVDGSFTMPPKKLVQEGLPDSDNPEYGRWFERDQAVMTLIGATLSQTALSYAVGSKTSNEMWTKLQKVFSSSSRTHIIGMKSELQNLVKKSTESIDEYIQRAQTIVHKLAAVSVFIDVEDLVLYIINGLPSAYNFFKTSIRTRAQPPTFDDLHVLLKGEEQALESYSKKDDSVSLTNLAMNGNVQSNGRGSWKNTNRGRGRFNGGRGHTNFNSTSSLNPPAES